MAFQEGKWESVIPLSVHPKVSCILSLIKFQWKGFPSFLLNVWGWVQFSFIIFIYCFIVKPFETLIVIRSCNKLDLL